MGSPLSTAGAMHIVMKLRRLPCANWLRVGAVRANDLPLSNDLEAWPDSSVGRALDVQSQGSRVRLLVGSVIFSHFHFSRIELGKYKEKVQKDAK